VPPPVLLVGLGVPLIGIRAVCVQSYCRSCYSSQDSAFCARFWHFVPWKVGILFTGVS